MPLMTRSSYVKDIPHNIRRSLCLRLDDHDDWQKIVGLIRSNDDPSQCRYSDEHIKFFERENRRMHGSPSEALLKDWSTQLPTIEDFLSILIEGKLYDTANFITNDILKQGAIKIPSEADFCGSMDNRGPLSTEKNVFSPYPGTRVIEYDGPTYPPVPPPRPSRISEDIRLSIQGLSEKSHPKLPVYRYSDLEIMTDSFASDPLSDGGRLLGKGGWGEVYLGTPKSEEGLSLVAVKRFHKESMEYVKQFIKELELIMLNCEHRNVLAIKGLCYEERFCILYEYMSNGNLEQRLKKVEDPLSAAKRLAIARDVASGIHYLHTFREKPVVHRDIKSANVLLDHSKPAKVGDFGLARSQMAELGSKTMVTTNVIGSTPYMPPEAFNGTVSPKWDVYSFGVVLLEMLTGRESYITLGNGEKEKLVTFIFDEDDDGNTVDPMSQIDPLAQWGEGGVVASQLLALIERCLATKHNRRPEMKEVLSVLMNIDQKS